MIHIMETLLFLPLVASMGVRRSSFLATQGSSGSSFGPSNCVSVERSPAGTCILRTQCSSDVDLETTEFAFLCVLGDGEVQKHSYGQGGFDAEETYDSSVACEQCLGPNQTPPVALHATSAESTNEEAAAKSAAEKHKELKARKWETMKAPAAAPAAAAPAKEGPKGLPVDLHTDGAPWKNESAREKYLQGLVAKPPHNVSFYGPANCVKTYLGEKGTCIMETNCTAESIKDHELGLTCVEKDGKSARHLFGKNAFNPEETFDTLIDCEICLGLDVAKLDKPMSIKDTIVSLKTEVEGLKKSMESVESDVKKLNAKVFPAPAAAAEGFVMHSREKKTYHVKDVSDEEQNNGADEDDRVEEVDEDEAPKRHSHHKAHKKHHKKRHHTHKHHRHAHRSHQEQDEEEQPAEEALADGDSSDSDSDGW